MHNIGCNDFYGDEQLTEVEIRPARIEDFYALYGKLPPLTCQALTVVYGGEVAAMAGTTLAECGYVIHMDIKQGISVPKIKIWRYVKKIMAMISQGKSVIYAGADDKYPNSGKFLRKLGFEYLCDDEEGGEVFIWQTHSQ